VQNYLNQRNNILKVKIGPYINYIGPYQIADKIIFWEKKEILSDDSHTLSDKLGKWLSENKDGSTTLLGKFCQWIYSKRSRKVSIHIDGYDSWNADYTLAMIIAPLLKKIKEEKNGFSFVDDEDVPDYLRSDKSPPLTQEEIDCGHYDELAPARWDWILDEMIWAFEQHADDDWEEQYYSGNSDLQIVDGLLINGPNHTFSVNVDGKQKHLDRMSNGRRLFAKYYMCLWT
jgi:hypothetical protein